jgi:hypothetical protein
VYKPNNKDNNISGDSIDFSCGSGGFFTEAIIGTFIIGMILLLLALHTYTYMRVYERKRKRIILHEPRHPNKKVL